MPAFAHPSPCLRRRYPISETFAVDGYQPLPPTGDSRKKKGGGEICACFRTPILFFAEETPHPWHFDLLTVISPSPRKSPGEAGALSLTPDGVSDPAASSGPRPSEAIPPEAKQGGGAKQGEGEARKAGEAGSYNSLIFLYLTFRFSLIVNSIN